MADREAERTARNKGLLARLTVPPTNAQVLAELDLEISDALQLATASDLRALARLLQMAKTEMNRLRQ
jgi:hypothetical protein